MIETVAITDWFPYVPRQNQLLAVRLATETFATKTVGMLSADCGVGKTIAVLSGYLHARWEDPDARLLVLTRTHSQSRVFEDELRVLRKNHPTRLTSATATSMVSRVHVCPIQHRISAETSSGFTRGCALMIRLGRCSYYWNFYRKSTEDGRPRLRDSSMELVDDLIENDVVTRDIVESLSESEGLCPYEVLRWCARQSRVIIGPYSYIFKERVRNALLHSLGQSLPDIDLLVDEAHNLHGHVLDSETATLTGSDLQWLRDNKDQVRKETGLDWINDAVEFLWSTLIEQLDRVSSKKTEISLNRWDVIPRFVEQDALALLMERTKILEGPDSVIGESPLDRLAEFLYIGVRGLESADWHISLEMLHRWKSEVSPVDAALKIRPLNAAGLTAPVLRGARSSLLMSGTLRPTEHYADLLGIKGALCEDIMSPFPSGSRMILLDKVLSTKYTERSDSLWQSIADKIERVLTIMPAEKSALIAFPSYEMMKQVLSFNVDCGYRKRIIEDREARIEHLQAAVETGPYAIFMVYGGKFSEGIDLVFDGSSLIDLIIGIGIPFSPPTGYQNALQNWYEERFWEGAGYYYSSVVPAVRQVVQLIGRLRRSPTDWGVVVLLDRRFRKYVNMFGEDAISDLWEFSTTSELEEAIHVFLRYRQGRNML